MVRKRSFSDKFWHDKNGKFVVWQKPNLFLWIWIVATVMSIIMNTNAVERFMVFIGGIAIIIWSIMEIYSGVNYFRRLLGVCVLMLIIASRFL